MVAIPRQCPYGADKAVQISWAVFFDKGTQPGHRRKETKSPKKTGYQIFFMPGTLSSNFLKIAILLNVLCTRNRKNVS